MIYMHSISYAFYVYTLYRKSNLCIPRNETAWPIVPIHVSVSDLYIPCISLPIWLQQNRQTNPGNICTVSIAHRYMSVEIERQNIIILFWK
jgi:hypothetical protein